MNRIGSLLVLRIACFVATGLLCSCGGAEASYYFPSSCRLPKWFHDIPGANVDVRVDAYVNARGREDVFSIYSEKHELLVRKTASSRGLEPTWLTLADGSKEEFEVESADGVTDVIEFVHYDPRGVAICTVDDPDIWNRLGVQK